MAAIMIEKASTLKPKPEDTTLGFGQVFTDHMLVAEYHEGKGWGEARIQPYQSFQMDPAAAVLHYGQAVFDGLKAFHGTDGKIRLFRPQKHVARLNYSAGRMSIPPMDPEMVLQSIRELVRLERAWVPRTVGTSLYIRPTIVASEAFLGVRPAKSYLFFVILSPVGAYYPEGMAPVKIRVEEQYVRAVAGGVGDAKTAGNYAASLTAAELAKHDGYTQVLWLDGVQRKYIDEVGTMNIMLRIGDEVLTPPLGGSILAGVTRDSSLTLLRRWGMKVSERQISIDELVDAHRTGRLQEVWGTGTAAVISPVGELAYRGERMVVQEGIIGKVTQRLYDAIVAIQYGNAPDPDGWTMVV